MSLKTYSYKDLINTALDFTCFCKNELKIDNLAGSWIIEAIRYVKNLSKTLGDEEAKTEYLRLNNQNSECLWSLTQLMELDFVYNNIMKTGKLDQRVLKTKVRKIIKAPFLPIDETRNTNESRNTLFELVLLGELLNHNYDAVIPPSDHPDIEVVVNNYTYAIECKRIFETKTFIRNFNRAKNQLENYSLNGQKYDYGIITINTTRVFNKGDKLLAAKDGVEAKKKALDELQSLFERYKNQIFGSRNLRIPTMFLHLSTPVVLEKQNPYLAWGHFLTICDTSNPS